MRWMQPSESNAAALCTIRAPKIKTSRLIEARDYLLKLAAKLSRDMGLP